MWLAAAVLVLLLAMAAKALLIELPSVRENSSPHQFDALDAAAQLQRVLGDQRPHAVDSEANDGVRSRILRRLTEIGLRPQVTDDVSCNASGPRAISCARVRNIVATMGPAEGRHVLLVSHYDSSPVGPGAADDGIGTAVMLETAAKLSKVALSRPVTFLFNEGEEAGLLGARAFLDMNPIAGKVDALVNLEARGVAGPALMFETSVPNGPAVAHYARSASRPSANSLSTDFYRLIPNSTDVAVFSERPWTILNLAIIGNETRYHSPGDTVAALDKRSLQHMGDQTLALALDLAGGTATARSGTWIFADLLGRMLVTMPLEVGVVLLALATVLALLVAWKRRRGWVVAAAAILVGISGSAALVFLCHALVGLLRPGTFWRAHPEIMSVAVAAAVMMACLLALRGIARSLDVRVLRSAYWIIFLLIGIAVASVAPGGIIFFLFPPLVALAGMLLGSRHEVVEPAAAVAATALLFLTLAPVLHLMEMLLDFRSAWIFAPLAALILLPALVELTPLLRSVRFRLALVASALPLIATWSAAAISPAYSMHRKQLFGIEYVRDFDEGTARWMVVNDGAPLPSAMRQAFSARPDVKMPHSARPRWSAPAPATAAPSPRIEMIGTQPTPSGRILSLRLVSGGAESLLLRAGAGSGLRTVKVGARVRAFGKGPADADYLFRCTGRRCDGLVIDLATADRRPVELTIVGTRYGLPAAAAPLIDARPDKAAPQYTPDATIGIKRVKL